MQRLKFLAPLVFGAACALPNTNYVQSTPSVLDRCVTYQHNSFQRFFASSSALSNNSTNEIVSTTGHFSAEETWQTNCSLSSVAIRIVQAKVAEVLGQTRAEGFAHFALQFRVVSISPEDLSALLENQSVNTTDRSSIVGHYDSVNRLIYISSALSTSIDLLSTLSHEFVHAAMEYFGGNYELASLRPLLIREGFPALVEYEIRTEFASEFGASERVGSYPVLRAEILEECNSAQGTSNQPCTSTSFRAFMLWPNGQLRSQ